MYKLEVFSGKKFKCCTHTKTQQINPNHNQEIILT